MLLGVELEPDPLDQIELGFEEIDVMFLVLHQALEQIARNVILYAMAVGRAFLVQRASGYLATVVAGTPIAERDAPTGEMPGRLIRGNRLGAAEAAATSSRPG